MVKTTRYNHRTVEKKWQAKWDQSGIYSPDTKKAKNPYYNLWMFPYPSAEGLHVGHAFTSTGGDIHGRFMRMQGKDVFQPTGYDSFGIHSENYALKIGVNPADLMTKTTKHYEVQLKSLGQGYDWNRTVTTSEPDYYKWTEWIFIQLFKSGLAYKKKAVVNFCPKDKTVLADEQVMTPKQAGKEPIDAMGNPVPISEDLRVCERCGTVSERRELEQWFFKITDYADRLLDGLTKIDWTEKVKVAQREWIGKKDGINITYEISGRKDKITVFTTAPVNFGATFIVVAPEYAQKYLSNIIPQNYATEVSKYIKVSLSKSEQQRKVDIKEKSGVFTGLYAINHVTQKEIPIWVADFVLINVGTGAVQGCPGHDLRDFQFAKKFGIPIIRVVVGEDGYDGPIENEDQVIEHGMKGKFVNSDFLNGVDFEDGLQKTMDYFEKSGWGIRVSNYHLRDWLISRQRYWGCPIPMIYCEKCAKESKSWFTTTEAKLFPKIENSIQNMVGWYPVPEEKLPVKLPYIKDWKPEGTGKGPLANHPDYYNALCPECGSKARRETDVADTFLDSAWYFLRYPSVDALSSTKLPFDAEITKKWLPVDLYFGGAEHAVLHLMYARFVTMVLHDMGYLSFDEPFPKFSANGLVIKDGAKMSKSRGNVINPDEYITKFGADALRMYLMFMGPIDGYPDFRDSGIEGMEKFIQRLWNVFESCDKSAKEDSELTIKMHQTIKKVTNDISTFSYNTAIAAIMEYVNKIKEKQNYSSEYLEVLAKLIAPIAPHLAEEVWSLLPRVLKTKHNDFSSIHLSAWPKYNEKYLVSSEVQIVVQINGRLRGQFTVDIQKSNDKDEIIKLAKDDQKVSGYLKGHQVKKEIFIPGKLVNFVV